MQIFTDASKEGRGNQVPFRKQIARKLKTVLLALKEFQDLCVNKILFIVTDDTTEVSYINTEIRPSVCPSMENPGLVLQETGDSQSQTYSRLAECYSRQLSRLGQTMQT